VSVNQQPYGSALVSAALTPTAAPASAPEPPEPKIELGIRILRGGLWLLPLSSFFPIPK